jgi:hypothetical protein
MFRKIALALVLPVVVAGCTAEPVWAPQEQVTSAVYKSDLPPSITLYTVINNRSGSGAHAALLVNGSHRVVFDPAGTFRHPQLPERNDVHFGMSPNAVALYEDYHARETFHIVAQTVEVSPEVAELALVAVQEYGAVPKAQCTVAVTRVLQQLPGFEDTNRTYFPGQAMQQFASRPGVRERQVFDNDSDMNATVLTKGL